MKAKTSSTTNDYHVILPKLDKKRDPVQDIAKGIGMLFVIFLHTTTLFTVGGRGTVPSGLVTILVHLQMKVPGVGMISGGRINFQMGAVEVF